MRKATGNMYLFVDYTWNPIKGKCIHNCKYCYMKQWGIQKDIRIDKTELSVNLGRGNYIFVCSGTDMFAVDVDNIWIRKVLSYCSMYNNKYLFQTKDPTRILLQYEDHLPKDSVIGTTIETNREDLIKSVSDAPKVSERVSALVHIKFPKMVTVEPIMDFDLAELIELIKSVNPKYVNIGADSKNHKLPEPGWDKIIKLNYALAEFTTVTMKSNIYRLRK